MGWDFEDESPGRDARGFAREGAMAPEIETHLVNAVLTNGARYYVDHAHPEYSSPECSDAMEAVLWDKAGERILARSIEAAAEVLPVGQEIVVYKNNSDRKGNSYGCHENYLLDRALPFARLASQITPHFVSRQIYTGAGKVGSEAAGIGSDRVPFQLTQRAEFFEEEVGLETTLKRPLVNTRDEPHSDSQRYRRLHVIVGDANLAEVSTFLKVGVTALVLAMIEDDELAGLDLTLAAPVLAHRTVSYDLSLATPLELANGRRMTALEMQWELLDRARKYAESRGLEAVGEDVGAFAARPLGGRPPRAGVRLPEPGQPAGLGGQVPDGLRLPRPALARLERPQAGRPRPPVPRRAPRPVAVREVRSGTAAVGGRRRFRHDQPAHHDPGVLPGPLPPEVGRFDRRRQLGLPGLRPRLRPPPAGTDDGTAQGNSGSRR